MSATRRYEWESIGGDVVEAAKWGMGVLVSIDDARGGELSNRSYFIHWKDGHARAEVEGLDDALLRASTSPESVSATLSKHRSSGPVCSMSFSASVPFFSDRVDGTLWLQGEDTDEFHGAWQAIRNKVEFAMRDRREAQKPAESELPVPAEIQSLVVKPRSMLRRFLDHEYAKLILTGAVAAVLAGLLLALIL